MPASFFSSTTLGKGEPEAVVLMHGLFSNSAFWLPYLKLFDNCQITLLNIDYPAFFAGGCVLDALSQHIEAAVGTRAPARFIGHSFGASVGLGLAPLFCARAFVCPTFCALDFDAERFCSEIVALTGSEPEAAWSLVAQAIIYTEQFRPEAVEFQANDVLYLASDDPYFRYPPSVPGVSSTAYCGGHFDVSAALRMVCAEMDPAGAASG